jgi:hypothetical protein
MKAMSQTHQDSDGYSALLNEGKHRSFNALKHYVGYICTEHACALCRVVEVVVANNCSIVCFYIVDEMLPQSETPERPLRGPCLTIHTLTGDSTTFCSHEAAILMPSFSVTPQGLACSHLQDGEQTAL